MDEVTVWITMHWPECANRRQDFLAWVVVNFWKERVDTLSPRMLRIYAKATTRLLEDRLVERDLFEDMRMRRFHGTISGSILWEALTYKQLAPQLSSLDKIKNALCEMLKKPPAGLPSYQIQPQTLKNSNGPINKFRPVQHLWAAHYYLHLCHLCDGEMIPTNMFPMFLSAAERFRDSGESTFLPRSAHPLIGQGEAVRLPGTLKLPKVVFGLTDAGFTITEAVGGIR
jgi:hypothetical protein